MQMSKARQESIARAEMIYRETVLAQYLIITGVVSIWHKLNEDTSWGGTITDWCVIAICLYFTYKANDKALDARSKWKELTK